MAVDFATLSITVETDGANASLGKLRTGMDQTIQKASVLTNMLQKAAYEDAAYANRSASGARAIEHAFGSVAAPIAKATEHLGFWDSIQRQATGHAGEHSLAIGRLERALAGVAEHTLGFNSTLGLLGATSLKFGVGDIYTIAIVAGLAAIGFAFDKLTENSRKTMEQSDKTIESLLKAARVRALGIGGEAKVEKEDIGKGVTEYGKRAGFFTGLATMFGSSGISSLFQGIAGGYADQIGKAGGATAEADKQIADAVTKDVTEKQQKVAAELARQQANLVRYNEMMEKAYGGTFDISPAARGPRSTWSANGQSMSDDERAALNKQLGIGAIPPVSIPRVGLTDSMTKEQIRQMEVVKQLSEAYQQSIAPFKSLAAAVTDFKQGLQQAATAFGQQFSPGAIGGRLLGKLAGDTSSAGGTAGGAAGLAIGEFVGGPFGAAIGAAIGSRIGNAVENLINGGGAAKRTADRLAADSAHAMAFQLDAVTKALSGDQLGGALDALKIGLISSLQAINDALPGKKNEAQRNADRARAAQQEAEQEAKTRKQFAEQQQYAQEDLQVRLLKATGQGSAGDLQAFKNQQAREMQAALDANKDALYINTLRTVQNSELLAFLNGTLQDATRNSPNGFFASAYYQQYATPRDYPTDSGPIGSDKTGWMGGGGGRSKGSSPGNFTLTFQPGALVVDKNGMMNVVLEKIDIAASGTGGAGSSRSAALDTMTRK